MCASTWPRRGLLPGRACTRPPAASPSTPGPASFAPPRPASTGRYPNLLDNACKWDPGGTIEVTVRPGRLEVRDHGPGIDAEDLPRVFDRFYRAAAARGRPGSGLGLAIVRLLAESHEGSVHATNDPGGGARLTIELPDVEMTNAGARWLGGGRAASRSSSHPLSRFSSHSRSMSVCRRPDKERRCQSHARPARQPPGPGDRCSRPSRPSRWPSSWPPAAPRARPRPRRAQTPPCSSRAVCANTASRTSPTRRSRGAVAYGRASRPRSVNRARPARSRWKPPSRPAGTSAPRWNRS